MKIVDTVKSMFSASDIPAAPASRDPLDDYWYDDNPSKADSSIRVAADTVVQIPECHATLSAIGQAVASLPLPIYRRLPSGGKEKYPSHPLYDILHSRPNALQTAYEFRFQMTWDLCLHRNAFAEIKDGPRGMVDSLTRLDPERVVLKTKVNVDGSTDHVYEHMLDDGRWRRLLPEQVFHLRAPPLISNNLLGRSLVHDGRRTFAMALAIQQDITNHFENDATPTGIITTQRPFVKQEEANDFRRKWLKMFRASRRTGAPAVLDGATSYTAVQRDNAKGQMIEAYKEAALRCVRLWRMPPHMVGILDRATFSNIEQQSLEFVRDTLMPWLVAWEQAISRDLIMKRDTFVAEHNVNGLLRGDIKSRYEAYAIGRNWGWLSVNQILEFENMNPIPEGDVYLQPLNMVPAGSDHATRAAVVAYVDRDRALASAIEALREPRALIAQSETPSATSAARCLADVDDIQTDAVPSEGAADHGVDQ